MGEKQPNQGPAQATEASAKARPNVMQIIAITVAIAVVILIAISFNAKSLFTPTSVEAKYTVLFKNIDLVDAAAVIESLQKQGIKDYKLEDGGKTILVPKKKKDSIAITIAGEGIMPSGGSVGFEIFDKGGQLGATDFDKQVKLSRAISGELSRNIMRIYGIEEARVQVVIPQKELFAEKKNPVQAAVFVKVASDMLLTPEQVQGIVSLVASSVEDLKKENITVVDYFGRILSSEEYANDYDHLYAMLQKKKLEAAKGSKDIKNLLLGDTGGDSMAGVDLSLEGKGSFTIGSLYKNLKKTKTSQQEAKLREIIEVKKKVSPENALELKLRFKEKYENMLESNVKTIASQFFPKNAIAAKVNVELNNLEMVNRDPASLVARVTTVLLLDENNKNVKLTPEIQEALFKAIASGVSYVRGRDRIDLRWSPLLGLNTKEKGDTGFSGFGFVGNLFNKPIKTAGNKPVVNFNFDFTFLYYVIGFLLLFKVLGLLRRKRVVIPETENGKSSIFEQKAETKNFDDLKGPTVEQVRDASDKAPERVAAIIEKWFQEDNQ